MIRGRHRGLPAAIDRAVMLPAELQKTDELILENGSQTSNDEGSGGAQATSYAASRRPSQYSETMNNSNQTSSVHQRFRKFSRQINASQEELYDVAENGRAGFGEL